MWADDPDTRAALDALGLDPGASLAQAKSAFRKRAMALHPDTGETSREALSELAAILRAIRHLERSATQLVDIEISSEDSRTALTRTVRIENRIAVFRIPAGARDGDTVAAVGEASIRGRIILLAATGKPVTPVPSSGLDSFVAEFAAGAPAARFARWLRKARSAA